MRFVHGSTACLGRVLSSILLGIAASPTRGRDTTGLVEGNASSVLALVEHGREALRRGQDDEDEAALLSAVKFLADGAAREPDNAVRHYDLACADLALETLFAQRRDNDAAGRWLARGIADAQRALQLDNRLADAHALLADLYGSKIGLKGFWAAIHVGATAEKETEQALRFDPNNVRAQLTLGRRYLYSPKIFGGDVARAVASFRQATVLDPLSDEAFRWLAIGCLKLGDKARARIALDEARRLNPRSRATQRIEAEFK